MRRAFDDATQVWTSTLKRTAQTARHLQYRSKTWKALDELDAGVCDDMTYDQIAELYPEDYAARDDDKYNYVRLLHRFSGLPSPGIGHVADWGSFLIFCSAIAAASPTETLWFALSLSSWSSSAKGTSFWSAIRCGGFCSHDLRDCNSLADRVDCRMCNRPSFGVSMPTCTTLSMTCSSVSRSLLD